MIADRSSGAHDVAQEDEIYEAVQAA